MVAVEGESSAAAESSEPIALVVPVAESASDLAAKCSILDYWLRAADAAWDRFAY